MSPTSNNNDNGIQKTRELTLITSEKLNQVNTIPLPPTSLNVTTTTTINEDKKQKFNFDQFYGYSEPV